ncbi:hypothetical protein [Myxococcus landrumensis]|uniref:Zinc-ribbon 15 domain-containing protein n=1 Tax=Myxococcus landrumensis TaxID=2813577 RepID=A0ABX7NCE0_9BACT|nr:hypothetical protein [Myxococcus landrumus]QSQ16323.1 hypothetical protein JY572_09855 [Myxococcus landrumus]
MFIITGSSPKQQVVGERIAPCPDCRQETKHRVHRHYAVKHLFWFPLFSMGMKYVQACTRCNLHSEAPPPEPGSVPAAPLLHRRGFMFPLGLLLLPCVVFPLLGALTSGARRVSSGSGEAPTEVVQPAGFNERFSAQPEDEAVQNKLQALFEEMGMRSVTLEAHSATVNGHVIRVITARSSRLKKVGDGDRIRLLEAMESVADEHFSADEVFLGLQGRLLWGGHSHRETGEAWRRVVDGSTPNPETDALLALQQREAPSAATAEPDAPVAPVPPPSAAATE